MNPFELRITAGSLFLTDREALQKKKERRLIQADRLSGFMFAVRELDLLQLEFNEKLWQMTVENVTVHEDGRMVWRFRNGAEVDN